MRHFITHFANHSLQSYGNKCSCRSIVHLFVNSCRKRITVDNDNAFTKKRRRGLQRRLSGYKIKPVGRNAIRLQTSI